MWWDDRRGHGSRWIYGDESHHGRIIMSDDKRDLKDCYFFLQSRVLDSVLTMRSVELIYYPLPLSSLRIAIAVAGWQTWFSSYCCFILTSSLCSWCRNLLRHDTKEHFPVPVLILSTSTKNCVQKPWPITYSISYILDKPIPCISCIRKLLYQNNHALILHSTPPLSQLPSTHSSSPLLLPSSISLFPPIYQPKT